MDFRQDVAQAQQHIADALRAAAQPSAFSQGVQPLAPQQQPQAAQPGLGVMPSVMQGTMPQMQGAPPQMQQPMTQSMPPQMGQPPMQQPPAQFAKGGLAVKGAWTRKEGKNPEGGLNAKGRASLRAQGQDIKPPVSAKQAKKSPKAAARRKSFCARMGGMEGPMEDAKGRPTRKALALRKWDC